MEDYQRTDPAERELARLTARCGAAMRGGVGAVGGAGAMLTIPESPSPVLVAVCATLVWTAVFAVVAVRRGLLAWAIVVESALTCALCLTQGMTVHPMMLPGGASWVAGLVTMTIVVVNFAWRPHLAVPVGLLVAAAHLIGARLADASDGGAVTAVIHIVQVVATAMLMTVLRRSARIADDTLAEALHAQNTELVSSAARDDERAQNRELHKTVLNTLTTVGSGGITGPSQSVCDRAAADLAVLEHLVGAPDAAIGPVALDQRLAEVAARGDLRVTLALEPLTVPAPVAEAFADAAAEALINTHRHAGVDHAALRLFTCDGAVQTEVRDAGCGFDRTRVPPYRYGVREGILSRMRSVGGDAAIDSGPGGTTVTLRWRP